MAKNNMWIFVAIIALLVVGAFAQKNYNIFAVTGSETMQVNLPATAEIGTTFQATYHPVASGTWASLVSGTISGGCTFEGGTTSKNFFMLSDEGDKILTITAPATATSCVFGGTYNYGVSEKTFTPKSITITKTCRTDADSDCNQILTRLELVTYLNKWINGEITKTKALEAVYAWSS